MMNYFQSIIADDKYFLIHHIYTLQILTNHFLHSLKSAFKILKCLIHVSHNQKKTSNFLKRLYLRIENSRHISEQPWHISEKEMIDLLLDLQEGVGMKKKHYNE